MNMLQMSEAMREGRTITFKQQMELVVALSIPAILEQLVHTMMGYIDTAMVGSVGYEATAAIGVVTSTIWLMNGIVNASAIGFSVQVAQYLGAGREKDSRDVLCQAILFNLLFGALLAGAASLLSICLPELLGAEAAIREEARIYFRTVSMFVPFSMAAVLYSGIYRCSGNVMVPSMLNIGMCVLDVIFNFFLIYPTREIAGITVWGAGLGVRGAALGTGLSQVCIGMSLLILLIKGKGPLRLKGDEVWKFTKPCMKNAISLAIPTALERITLSGAQIVMTAVVASMGAVAVAANYVAVQTEGICYLPAYGVASAATAIVGQSVGAGRTDMAKRFAFSTVGIGAALIAVTSGIMYVAAPALSGFLTQEAEVIALSVRVLRIVAFSEPLFAVSIVAIGALRGAGDSKGPFVLSLCSMWGIRVFSVLLWTKQFGLIGVWGSMTVELATRGVLFFVRLWRGKWIRKIELT